MSTARRRDLDRLSEVGVIVGQILARLEQELRIGQTTLELDDLAARLLESYGARSAPRLFYDFPGSICISVNEEVVHGVPGSRRIEAGDLVTVDVTAEKHGWIADAARTVLVPPVAPESQRMLQAAEQALADALEVARVGNTVRDISRAIEGRIAESRFRIIPELTGHGVGRSIHERPVIPNYDDPAFDDRLTDGLVVAIEPIISSGSGRALKAPDGWTVVTADSAPAVHVEQTVVIGFGEPLIVTGPPRTIADPVRR